jgi:hypothetical protein
MGLHSSIASPKQLIRKTANKLNGSPEGTLNFRAVQIGECGGRSVIALLGKLDRWPVARESDWCSKLVKLIGVAELEQRTNPSSLDGCPMFA